VTWPGPAALGRGLVVSHAQPVPEAWRGAPEAVVDDGALTEPQAVVTALHRSWAERAPVVVRLLVDPVRFRDPVAHDPDPIAAGVSFEPWLDRLHHLVWANTYDGRTGDPVWWWGRKAVRLGAAEGGPADVVLADGTPAWVDGGPAAPVAGGLVDGHPLVHRDTIELRRLTPRPAASAPRADLAPDQLAAVAHGPGPARIVAPAGSGKTRVLTERVRHLVRDRGYDPESLLAVAFNVRAKQEMESRLQDVPAVRVQTLNGLGWWVLREARGRDLRVLGERDVRDVVGRLVEVRRQTNTDPISPYLDGLSRIRLGLAEPKLVEADLDGEADGLAEMVWPRFRDGLARAGGVDFDEQVFGAVEALLADGGLRRWAQERCRHLLVDEFQDLTPCHLLLVRLLAAPGLDVFGVGDDDQVLYGYMGATPRFLIDFERWFPGGAAHPLEVNHRCPAAVTSAAVSLLERNRVRVVKEIRPGPSADPDPDCLQIRRHTPERAASEVLEVVQGWIDAGAPPRDVAVLSRVNSLLLAPQVALREAGVPVASDLGEEVLRRTGVQAALAYLRLAADPGAMAGADIGAILKRPSRGGLPRWLPERLHKRGHWSVRALRQLCDTLQKDRERQNLMAVASDLERLAVAAKGGVRATLTFVRDDIGLGQAMGLLDSSKGGQGGSNLDDLEALLQLADLHDEIDTFEVWLRGHLALATDEGGVTLATVHRVKGQEWDHVVLFGMTDGISPHRLADDLEEERRIVHVGITRARRRVVVLGDAARPSRFLDELEGRDPPLRAPAGRPVVAAATSVTTRRAPVPIVPGDPAVSAALRAWRSDRARQEGKPPYIYLTDALLEAIATKRPATLLELRALPGIGPKKLDEYGDDLLNIVREATAADRAAPAGEP
jgi:DNA helicase-2/ATP-dependent DNA helicase PcrA